MRFFPLIAATIFLAPAGPALALDQPVVSTIEAVTVYPDAALVTRSIAIDVPAGTTSLVVSGLPIGLDPASLRAAGEASGALTIEGVDARLAVADAKPDSAIDARLKGLRGDRAAWQVSLDALEAKKAMILRFSQAGPEKLSPEAKPVDIAAWPAAWDAVATALAKVGDDIRAAQVKAKGLDDDIAALEAARAKPNSRAVPSRDVTVTVSAAAPAKGTLTLAYRVADAHWQPVYDARLDTGHAGAPPTLDLVRRAAVVQRTGEDWNDVALTISTIHAVQGTAAPEVAPQRLAFWEPPALPAGALATPMRSLDRAPAPDGGNAANARPPAPMQAATERQASLEAGAFQAAFKVPGRISLAADGTSKVLAIATRRVTPDLSVTAAPALDPTAYLAVRFTNDEEAPLLPGSVGLYRDGTYVGAGRLGVVAPGEAADLGFGADDRVRITRVPVQRKENEPNWLGQTKTETCAFKTTVKNLHDVALRIAVIDRVPFSENTAITVETLPATTPPTEKTVADKRGVMGWTYAYAPGETKDVKLAYRLKWPADRDVTVNGLPTGTHCGGAGRPFG